MKIEGAKNSEEDMFEDNKAAIPTDMQIEPQNEITQLQIHTPRNSLVQEFGDFSFLLQLQRPEQVKIGQVIEDLKRNRDHFLNANIKSLITYASLLKEQGDFNMLITIVKQILRRKCTHSHEIITLVKFCFLFRKLIEVSSSFQPERRLTLYREILDLHENHYNSSFTNTHIIQEINLIQRKINETVGFEIQEEYPFQTEVVKDPNTSPLYQVYVGQLLKVNILDFIHNSLPGSLDILAKIQKYVNHELTQAILPTTLVLEKVQQFLLSVPNDNQAVSRQQIQHILKCAEQLCSDGSQQQRQRITEMELQTAAIFFKSPSIDKKLWALSAINDKIRLLRMGNKGAGVQLIPFLDWLQNIGIYEAMVQQNVHPEVLARSSQLVRFLYEKQKIGQDEISNVIKFTIKSQSDSISKFAHNLIIILDYRHLESVFELILLNIHEKNHICPASIKIVQSIISAHAFNPSEKDKKNKRKRTYSGAKDEKKGKGSRSEVDLFDDGTIKQQIQPKVTNLSQLPKSPKPQASPLLIRIFNFLISHLDSQYPLIPVLTKLINCQPLLFAMIPQQLIDAVREDRHNSIAFLDSMMRLQFPIGKEKGGMWSKHQFVNWLANEGMFQYLLAGIAKNRFEKSLNQRLQILVLLGRNYKPFEKGYIEFLWKILGLRALDQRQREQFFVFVKDCLVRSNTQPLFTEQAVNYVYFGILLRLESAWFSLKIYECFEMFFLRLNQDCKLISSLSSPGSTGYQLLDPQLIGLNKFWYIYLTCDDQKVTKKCKDFLCRLVSKFDCEQKIFSTIKHQYVLVILSRMNESLEELKHPDQLTVDTIKLNKLRLGRCLEMIIRVIEELEGKRLSNDKTSVEEWTFNIQNTIAQALPPKKFTLKVDIQCTLKQLKELIGSKINPVKKGSQLKLMTQGRYVKGENLTMKQLKFSEKQHFIVEISQQIQPDVQMLDQGLLANMKMMFPNHTEQIIRYVLHKRHGEDQQTIAQVLLDDQAVQKYQQQIQSALPSASKQVSQMLSSTQDIFETFFEVLNLQSQQLSLLTWKIISNIPNNPFHTELIRDTILKTNDWNQIISMNPGSLFKTLYNLQLLRTMLTTGDMHEDLSQKFVENGGFEHLYKIAKMVMQKWAGDALEAKLLGSLLQVIKIYIKPQLQAQSKKPLLYIFKEVTNYRNHLKDIAHHDIQNIVSQIVTPQLGNKDITFKSQSSFSFKGRSNSSNLTPNFQSPINSRSNSPHSEKPDKDQDNLSSISGSKSSNVPRKRGGQSRQDSFTVKMQQNVNLQLQLNHVINSKELTKMILHNLGIILKTEGLADSEDVAMLAEELFDVLFPSLLVNSSFEAVYGDPDTMMTITQGLAFASNEQLRMRLVYFVFLLCVISDILNQNQEKVRINIQDDDQLFMRTQNKQYNPRIIFIQQLLPLFQPKCNLHESYFICLTKLIKQVSTEQLEQLLSPQAFIKQAIQGILARPIVEEHQSDVQDDTFNGLLVMLQVLLERYKHLKEKYSYIVPEIFTSLFALHEEQNDTPYAKNYPKCKRKSTRMRCFGLLLELARGSAQTRKLLSDLLCKYCIGLTPKQYESTVMRIQKYSGLRNLGATCYINSLLQQIHKNTLLPQMLCCKDIIPIEKGNVLFPLAHLMASMSLSIKNTINPTQFIKSIKFHGNVEINPLVQQDVNQFFMAFVELLESNNARNLLQSTMMGEVCNEISAEDNDRKFVKKGIETFFTITLDIKGKRSLMEALQLFIKADILDGDNMYHSQELGKKVRATRRSYFRKLPNCLVFTLKRFEFDYNTMLRYKLNDYLEFPMELDILRFSEQHISEQSQNLFDQNYYKYRLTGVLVHSGNAESGHYYSFIRDSDKWYEFNDSVVSEFNIANLKAETFGGEDSMGKGDWDIGPSRSRNAYLLFYERIQPVDNNLSVQVKDKQIKGEFFETIWKENLQFLKARLVFDADFLKFVDDIFELTKDQQLAELLIQLRGTNKKQQPKTDIEVQEFKGIEPIAKESECATWSRQDNKDEEKLIKELIGDKGENRLD